MAWNRDPRWARYGESAIIRGLRMGVKRWPTTDSAHSAGAGPALKGGKHMGHGPLHRERDRAMR